MITPSGNDPFGMQYKGININKKHIKETQGAT